jgi:K+-transporting ATPase c subunit
MKKHILTALLMTLWTTVLLGVVYPLLVVAGAHLFCPD